MPRRRQVTIPLLLLALVLVTAPMPAAPEWKALTSPHFEIYTTASAGLARETLRYFENIYDFFDKFLHLRPDAGQRVRVVMFSSEKEFAPYQPSKTTAAYYVGGLARETIVIGQYSPAVQPVVVHEYTHLLVNQIGGYYPLWLNEGLAEFFSTFERAGTEVRLGRVPGGLMDPNQTRLPLARILEMDWESPEYRSKEAVGMVYAQSWALTHMVMVGERYRGRSAEFIKLVASGGASADAFATVYGRTVEQVQEDLASHFRRPTVAGLVIKLPPFDRVDATPIPVSESDVRVALAELVSGEDETVRMREAFAALTGRSLAELEARSLMEARAGNAAAAREHLSAAVSAGSQSPLIRALAAAYEAQRLLSDNAPDQALAVLGAITQPPRFAAFSFFEALAESHTALTDYPLALDAATRARRVAFGTSQIQAATALATRARGPADLSGTVRGRLVRLVCDAPQHVLEVSTAAGLLRFVVDNRGKIVTPAGQPFQLPCGVQDRRIRIGFSLTDPPAGIDGRVRLIDLR